MSDSRIDVYHGVRAVNRGPSLVAIGLNPTLDRTIRLDALVPGTVLRASDASLTAGGKALNLCRAARTLGAAPVLVGPVPGELGRLAERLAVSEGIECRGVPTAGELRGTTVIIESNRRTTIVNEPGPELGVDEWAALRATASAAVDSGATVAICGSAPPGTPRDADEQLIAIAHAAGGRVAVDANGPRLVAAAVAGADLVSPNLAEAERALGSSGQAESTDIEGVDRHEVMRRSMVAADALVGLGARSALVSAGPMGVAWRTAGESGFVAAPVVDVVNPIGAGDAFLGATLVALDAGATLDAAVRRGVAYAAASVRHPVAGYADLSVVEALLPRVHAATRPEPGMRDGSGRT